LERNRFSLRLSANASVETPPSPVAMVAGRFRDLGAAFGSAERLAFALARRTPRVVGSSIFLLLAGVLASRLHLWANDALWSIPSLGAASLGVAFWLWSANMVGRPDLSIATRESLQRAMLLQLASLLAALLALVYFGGMLLRAW
jgi:hypothetical protein